VELLPHKGELKETVYLTQNDGLKGIHFLKRVIRISEITVLFNDF
jgi:hypothetical protein